MFSYRLMLNNLPEGWKIKKIFELGTVTSGGTPSRVVTSFWQGDTPWLTPREVSKHNEKYLSTTTESITESGLRSSGANLLPTGSLLVTSRATLGERVINAVPMTTNQGFKSIIFKTPEDAEYYFHFFSLLKSELERRASGTTFLEISGTEFSDIDLPVPPENERNKINEVLDTLNDQILDTEAFIDKLQQVKQGLLHDLLTRGVNESGELRPSFQDAPELYKPSELGYIPKSWDVQTIDELGGFVTSGSRDWAQYYSEHGDLFIRIGNLTREHINFRFEKIQYVAPPQCGDGQRTKLVSGDILISITADLGIIGVMSDEIGTAYINQHVAMVRFTNSEINPRFIGHFLASQIFQTLLSSKNDAGAKAGLNLPTVRNFPILKIEKVEQNEITNRLDSMDKNIQIERTNLNKLKLQKSGLMDDLLTGKKRVTKLLNKQTNS